MSGPVFDRDQQRFVLGFEHLPGILEFILLQQERRYTEIMDMEIQRWTEETPPGPEEMKAQLREEGFSGIHEFSDAPGREYPDHQHGYVEVRWVVDGEVTFGVDGREYTLGPGDRLNMPANTVHNARMHPERGATYICASS